MKRTLRRAALAAAMLLGAIATQAQHASLEKLKQIDGINFSRTEIQSSDNAKLTFGNFSLDTGGLTDKIEARHADSFQGEGKPAKQLAKVAHRWLKKGGYEIVTRQGDNEDDTWMSIYTQKNGQQPYIIFLVEDELHSDEPDDWTTFFVAITADIKVPLDQLKNK